MSKIIRRPDFAGGGVTDEELKRLEAHSQMWIARAFRTTPISKEKITAAIKKLYAVAGLKEPRVVVVPSPRIMAMAGMMSISILNLNRRATRDATHDATHDATYAATRAATREATRAATHDATHDATYDATYAATYAATDAATREATRAATHDATHDATYDATYAATYAATRAATHDATYDATYAATYAATHEATDAATAMAMTKWWKFYQGGNMWAGMSCYLSAFRDVLGLRLPIHEKYAAWEECAIEGGFRFMYKDFCIVSDFPEILKVDAQNRPHAEMSPSHRWRDGWELFYLHGIKVPEWLAVSHPDDLDPRLILQLENVDQRREGIRRLGSERIVEKLGGKVLSVERREVGGYYELLEIEMNHGAPWKFLRMQNQSIEAIHIEAVPRECETVQHAINWRYENIDQDWFPSQLT